MTNMKWPRNKISDARKQLMKRIRCENTEYRRFKLYKISDYHCLKSLEVSFHVYDLYFRISEAANFGNASIFCK